MTSLRTGTVYDDKCSSYTVSIMGNECIINLKEKKITGFNLNTSDFYNEFELLILSYMINAKDVVIEDRWISEKEIPGGNMFFTGPHKLSDKEIIEQFGKDAASFTNACKKINGKSIDYGDATFAFTILPKIPFACVLWEEDDEFPSRVTFLFDTSIKYILPLDTVIALVNTFIRILIQRF